MSKQNVDFVKLLGDVAVTSSGSKHNLADVIKGKYVALYFSAAWCGACKLFTPVLSEIYEKFNKNLEVLFVSADHTAEEFASYFKTMPWKAIPYGTPGINTAQELFNVEKFPTLIMLNSEGKVINKDATGWISDDPEGNDFPWIPVPVMESMGTTFFTPKNELVSLEQLKENDYIGLYFSAFSNASKEFTPELKKAYETVRAQGKKFEIIFYSYDKTEKLYEEYRAWMPWLTVPYSEKKRINATMRSLEVTGGPTLVIVNPKTGEVVNKEGRLAIAEDKEFKEFPWNPRPWHDLSALTAFFFDESACLIVLADGKAPESIATTSRATTIKVAEEFGPIMKAQHAAKPLTFLHGTAREQEITSSLRGFLAIPEEKTPVALLLNLPEQMFFVTEDVSEESIRKLAESYFSGSVKWQQINNGEGDEDEEDEEEDDDEDDQ